MDILQGLNDKQKEAVIAIDGNIRVTAGAGSGKTRVLAHRYAFLVNEVGINPSNILCMTFTNKAAQEMKNRISKMVHVGNVNDFVCTIHGFCVKFLREEIFRLGFPSNFAIIDEEDSKTLSKQIFDEFGYSKQEVTIKQFLTEIRQAKSHSPYVEQLVATQRDEADTANYSKDFVRYVDLQLKNFALDFDDLIHYTLYILASYEDVRDKWQNRINYLMIDEAQDCSCSDWQIIDSIQGEHHNVFIVGDPDKCIYEWRGATPAAFINFKADKDIILSENYRSTPDILNVANSIITNNKLRIKKDLFTEKGNGKIVVHYHAPSEVKEGDWIAKQIENIVKGGAKYSDFAILYRASYQSRFIEQALLRKHIQYTVWGGVRFFERKEIKDALAYLRLLAYHDDISFVRIINVPSRKFGKKSLERLISIAEGEKISLFEALCKNITLFRKPEIIKFIHLFNDAESYKENHSISDTLDYLLKESGYKDLLRLDDDQERIDNLQELLNSVKYYEEVNKNEENLSVETYLQDIALYTNADYKKDMPTVKLMTIHQSKGLEFPYVIVCGLTEGIFPSHRAIRERREKALEEERRLMYVAVTRAEKILMLTESEGYNYTTKTAKYPSRFLHEIGTNLIKVEGNLDSVLFEGTKYNIELLDDELNGSIKSFLKVGDTVKHKFFGTGTIEAVNAQQRSYTVKFSNGIRDILANKLELSENSTVIKKPKPKTLTISDLKVGQKVFDPQNGIGVIEEVNKNSGRIVIDHCDFVSVSMIGDPLLRVLKE